MDIQPSRLRGSARGLLALALLASVLLPAAATAAPTASPLAGPCLAGASYNPACDVNQDGVVNVLDIQLTAGHFNQTGAFTSDNNHIHLGQLWTGSSPLVLQGSYGFPFSAPLVLSNSDGAGLRIHSASGNGLYVASAGDSGLSIGNADDGVHVNTATGHGLYVNSAGGDGISVNYSAANGLYVLSSVFDGVNVAGNDYAGLFRGNVNITGTCTGCLQANFAINTGERALQPGDAVSIQSVATADFDNGPALWLVMPAEPGQAIVGVVAGWAEEEVQERHRPAEHGRRLVPREGAAQPSEYVTVVYSGPMQVRVTPGEATIAAGTRLTAATDGTVRPLQTRSIDGMVVTEGAPVLGVALDAPKDGSVWVLVDPQ